MVRSRIKGHIRFIVLKKVKLRKVVKKKEKNRKAITIIIILIGNIKSNNRKNRAPNPERRNLIYKIFTILGGTF